MTHQIRQIILEFLKECVTNLQNDNIQSFRPKKMRNNFWKFLLPLIPFLQSIKHDSRKAKFKLHELESRFSETTHAPFSKPHICNLEYNFVK